MSGINSQALKSAITSCTQFHTLRQKILLKT
jgi:hypothetical protein